MKNLIATYRLIIVCFCILFFPFQASWGAATPDIPKAAEPLPGVDQIGPNDQLSIWAFEVEELNGKLFRVDGKGYIDLPLAGRVKAAGKTAGELKEELIGRFKVYVRDPRVTVTLAEGRSKPVSVIGAVKSPGIHQLEGRKTLIEMISLAGGFREDAGYSVKITRDLKWGKIPLANAAADSSGKFSVAEVRVKDLVAADSPVENIQILPDDVVSVPKTELFYVVGDVHKPGGFPMGETKYVPVFQALSMAEGVLGTASEGHSRIVRPRPGSSGPAEIPVDVKKIMKGKGSDVTLQAGDILYIPSSTAKKVTARAIEAGIGLGTGVLIWRR